MNTNQMVDKELANRLQVIEKERDDEKRAKERIEKQSAVNEVMAGFAWQNDKQRALLAKEYAGRIEKDDSGTFVLEGERAETFIKREIQDSYQSLRDSG